MIEYVWVQNIQFDALYGASLGAINCSLFHAIQIQALLDMWMRIKSSDVYKLNLLTLPLRMLSQTNVWEWDTFDFC